MRPQIKKESHLFLVIVDFVREHGLLAHGLEHGQLEVLLALEARLDVAAQGISRQLDVLARLVLVIVQQSDEAVVRDVHERVLLAADAGHHHVVRARADVLVLASVEDIDADQMNLGVAVLARLGRRHLHDLARSLFDQHKAVLAQRRALHGEARGRARFAD